MLNDFIAQTEQRCAELDAEIAVLAAAVDGDSVPTPKQSSISSARKAAIDALLDEWFPRLPNPAGSPELVDVPVTPSAHSGMKAPSPGLQPGLDPTPLPIAPLLSQAGKRPTASKAEASAKERLASLATQFRDTPYRSHITRRAGLVGK